MTIGESNLSSMVDKRRQVATTLSVPAIGLPALISAHGIGDDVLVADIEGAEAGLLVADAPALHGCQMMIAELHDKVYAVADMIRLTEATGFRMRDRYGDVCMFRREPGAA